MQVDLAARLLKDAKYTIALTGAGISTPSGIPDFRSADNGLWNRFDPMEVASLSSFRVRPEKFFEWFRPLTKLILEAKPNPAHKTLAGMEKDGILKATITQNIDGLHQRAGAKKVMEVHGTIKTLTCVSCFKKYDSKEFIHSYVEHGKIPRCEFCDSILKPDAILFGEQLPQLVWMKIKKEVEKCDLMIVVGSSLEVVPVARLPYETLSRGGNIIIINNQETYLDSRANLVFHQDAAVILPKISEKIRND